MSNKEDSKKNLKDVTNQAGDVAKHIWLAGLGAYGRAFDEAQERYEQASKETPRLFKDLVKKGTKLEEQARKKLNEAASKGKNISIEDRIGKMRSSLGFGPAASAEDLQRLEKKVDALAKKVASLSKDSTTAPARKAPAKRSASSKSNS